MEFAQEALAHKSAWIRKNAGEVKTIMTRSELRQSAVTYNARGITERFVAHVEPSTVTFSVFRGIFSLGDVRWFGVKLLGGLLRSGMPELYAEESRRDIEYAEALSNSAAALSEPFKATRIYEVFPDVRSAEVQVFADLMAKNRNFHLMLMVRRPDAAAEAKFRKDMTQEIMLRRKTAGEKAGGVNLSVTTSEKGIAALLEGEQVRGLVYGDEDALELGNTLALVRHQKMQNILIVRNDSGKENTTQTSASALLAAFERLFDPQTIPDSIVSTSSLLAQYIQLQGAVERLIGQSA